MSRKIFDIFKIALRMPSPGKGDSVINRPLSDARYLIRLIEQTGFFGLPENPFMEFNPHEFRYTITVDAGIITHTVRTPDTSMPKSLRPLVDELSSLEPMEIVAA